MLLTLLMLIVVFLFDHTLGKTINTQCNNRHIYEKDLKGMQHVKQMLWSDQANLYTNPLTSRTSDGIAFKQSSVPISNGVPASIIKQHSVPNDGPAHFKQLSVPTKSLTTTSRNLLLLCNKDNSEIMNPCLLHPAKCAANHAIPRNLLLLYVRNGPAIIIPSLLLPRDFERPAIMTISLQLIVEFPSLLLFCVKDAPAIMMVTFANFSLQLIVDTPSLLLLCDFERPAITAVTNGNFFFKFIVESILEGAQFAPNFDGLSVRNFLPLLWRLQNISWGRIPI